MITQKKTTVQSHAVLPPSLSDDAGMESSVDTLRSNVRQVAQETANLSIGVEQGDFDQEATSRRSGQDQSDATEARYSLALAEIMESKRSQATQLEERLIKQSQQQKERLTNLKKKPPGILSLPSTKKIWKNEVRKEANKVQQTDARLLVVRELRDGLGPLIPRLQEIAAAKLRVTQPDLARARDEMRRLERAQVHQGRVATVREQEQKKPRSRSQDLSLKQT